jgi:riboflavin kinase/FMN adenylyltransferase
MQHVSALEDLSLDRPACVTIGAFDGVHRGHQALIEAMTAHAHAMRQAAVAVTFFPHPSVVLRGRRPSFYISDPGEKAEALAAHGVDAVVTHPFSHEVANTSAADFVARLARHTHMRELWCGADFALGHNRQGDVTFLRAEGERRGFIVNVVAHVIIDGEVISSSRIRQALRDGAVETVTRYLGRPFRLPGKVIEGAKRGRSLGIPTANLAVWEERAFPGVGVYAGRAHVAGRVQPAVVNIGFRPTFESTDAKPVIEAHLLDFSGDLYGATVALEFIARLRAEMKFSGVEALVAQIQRDIAEARQILEKAVGRMP